MMAEENKVQHSYDESDIQVLEGLEAVRKRPGMYIGSVSVRGLHHLVYEIVDNCVDEALAGYCKNIHVIIEPGNIISVEDDGRGIPVEIHPKTKISTAETVYTVLHAGGKFGGDSGYKVSGGLHGVGSSVVNALSEWTEVTIQRDGGIFQMKFERGKTVEKLTRIGDSKKTGTKVRFLADDTIFETLEYEYEVEKGGEVALEQFHVTRLIHPAFNIRAGHMIVPVGLTNSHHEPINFFGTSRPEGETTILPSTWHETGVSIFGSFGKGYASFDYEAMAVAGLNPDGFGRDNWVAGGKQGIFETDNFSSPGYAARINYTGVPGLRVGVSGYYCHDVTKNADKPWKYSTVGRSALKIISADAQYRNRYVTARGNFIWGDLDNASGISAVNSSRSTNSYPSGKFRVTAKNALCYGAEVGINVSAFFNNPKVPVLYPFARYDYYNPQEKGDKDVMDKRMQVCKWTAGINWYALPNLVVKLDYTTRHIGTAKPVGSTQYNHENEFSIGVAYVGWFTKR